MQEAEARRKAQEQEVSAAEQRYLELQQAAKAKEEARRKEASKKKKEQGRVLGKKGSRDKISFKLG